jgi:hypothetical protein
MKSVKLGDHIRISAKKNRDIILPLGERTHRTWPLCCTCFKEVFAVEMANYNNNSCDLIAKCDHQVPGGPVYEDSIKVLFEADLDNMDPLVTTGDERANWSIKRAMHDFSPFQPEHQFDTSRRPE